MKNLLFISFYLLTLHFLFSQTFPSQSCERLFTSTHLFTLSSECSDQVLLTFKKKENTMLTETTPYKVFYRTNEPVNASNCNFFLDIKRPIIIVEGFDFRKEIDVDDIYREVNENDALTKLRSEGYDIITYNIFNPVYSIETNARALTNFITFINNQKQTSEELVIMGISMGGLLVRYTLTEMELNGKPHHTRLFVSLDAPQAGAYVPLSMQELVVSLSFDTWVLASAGLGGGELYPLFQLHASLRSPAALQMLKYDSWNLEDDGKLSPNPCHESFMERLRAKNNNNGYPLNCKNIAITNGSFTGARNNGFDQTGATPGNIALKFHVEGTPRNYELRTIAGNNDRWDQTISIFNQGSQNTNFSIKENLYSFENAPGGFSDWYNIAIDVINAQPKMILSEHHNNSSCFIPVISSLDLFTNNPMINLSTHTKQTVLNNSAFDDIYWNTNQSENTFHTQLTPDMSTYFFNQVINNGSGSDYCKSYRSDRFIVSNIPDVNSQVYNSTNVLNIGNSTINPNNHLFLSANSSVILKDGFWAKSGSIIEAKTSPCTFRRGKTRPALMDLKVIESNVKNTFSSGLGAQIFFYQVDLEAQTTTSSNIEWLINNRNAGNTTRITIKGNDGKIFTPNSYVKLNVTNGFQVGSWKGLINASTLPQTRVAKDEFYKEIKTLLYPNPADGIITIETSGSFIMNLLDINGKLLKEFTSDNSTNIDLKEYNSGSYIIKIQTASSSETFVIQLL